MSISAGILRYPVCERKNRLTVSGPEGRLWRRVASGICSVTRDRRVRLPVWVLPKNGRKNIKLMRLMLIAATLFAETFGTSLFAADKNQASNSAIEQQLTAQYRLTTVNQ
jgi:hypothetical protein